MFENFSFDKLFENIEPTQVLRIVLIFLAGLLIIRVLRFTVRNVFGRNLDPQAKMIVQKLISWSGYFLVLIIILTELEIELTAILGAAGIFGVAIGVASQKSLGNIISGVFLVSEGTFQIGDVIRVGDRTGIVNSVNSLAIMLKTFDNLLIRIPNETLISTEIVNITRFPIRRQDFSIAISYKDDLATAVEVLKKTAQENFMCLDEPEPLILIEGFGDSGINMKLGVWFEKTNFIQVKNAISIALKKNFEEAGISIPFPHMTLYWGEDQKSSS
jgi:small-conductance mechanosensitive channel